MCPSLVQRPGTWPLLSIAGIFLGRNSLKMPPTNVGGGWTEQDEQQEQKSRSPAAAPVLVRDEARLLDLSPAGSGDPLGRFLHPAPLERKDDGCGKEFTDGRREMGTACRRWGCSVPEHSLQEGSIQVSCRAPLARATPPFFLRATVRPRLRRPAPCRSGTGRRCEWRRRRSRRCR